MVILGVVLLLLGFFLHIQVLWIIGIILVVVGAILLLLPVERVGGRRWY
jgi:Zn-dependent membrane protease YugP